MDTARDLELFEAPQNCPGGGRISARADATRRPQLAVAIIDTKEEAADLLAGARSRREAADHNPLFDSGCRLHQHLTKSVFVLPPVCGPAHRLRT